MTHGNGVSRGDRNRNRNARLARLRELVPVTNAIVAVDLADHCGPQSWRACEGDQ